MSDLRSGGRARQAAGPGPQAQAGPRPLAEPRRRPDPGPLRLAIGMTGIAAASAIASALMSSSGANADVGTFGTVQTVQTVLTLPADPTPSPRHVVQYVQLLPGQTAPPKAIVKQAPAPKPRIVVVTTRQSGSRP